MEITKRTKITRESHGKSLERLKADKSALEAKAMSIRDGVSLRENLARGIDNRVIDKLGETERGRAVMDDYIRIKEKLGADAYRQSEGIYNEVLPNGDRRRKLTEVNPMTGEVRNCMQKGYSRTFSFGKLPYKK